MPKKSKLPSTADCHNNSPLSPINLTALRRCRPLFIKDLDVDEILRNVASSDGGGVSDGGGWLGPEVRALLLAIPDSERRATALLDALESSTTMSTGSDCGRANPDEIFAAFVEELRISNRNRKLYAVLDETLRTLNSEFNRGEDDDEDSDDCDGQFIDRTSVPGHSVRRLLRRYAARQQLRQRQSTKTTAPYNRAIKGAGESLAEMHSNSAAQMLEVTCKEDYVECFTVATRGLKLQPEPWIKHAKASSATNLAPSVSVNDGTVIVTKDLVFRRLDRSSLPPSLVSSLRLPPSNFESIYVVDSDYKFIPSMTTSTKTAARHDGLPPPRLQPTVLAKGPTAVPTTDDNIYKTISLTNDGDGNSPISSPVPPLPPKPREFFPFADVHPLSAANKNIRLPPPLPSANIPSDGGDTDTASISLSINEPTSDAPPLPERKSRAGISTTDVESDVDQTVRMSPEVPNAGGEIKRSLSSMLPMRRASVNGDLSAAACSDDESETSVEPPPELPPRMNVAGHQPPLPVVSIPADGDVVHSGVEENVKIQCAEVAGHSTEANINTSRNSSSEPTLTLKPDEGPEPLPVRSVSMCETNTTSGLSITLTLASTACSSETTSLLDGDDAVDGLVMNRPISNREDSGIVVSLSSPVASGSNVTHGEAKSVNPEVDEQMLPYATPADALTFDSTTISGDSPSAEDANAYEPVSSALNGIRDSSGNESVKKVPGTTTARLDFGMDSSLPVPGPSDAKTAASTTISGVSQCADDADLYEPVSSVSKDEGDHSENGCKDMAHSSTTAGLGFGMDSSLYLPDYADPADAKIPTSTEIPGNSQWTSEAASYEPVSSVLKNKGDSSVSGSGDMAPGLDSGIDSLHSLPHRTLSESAAVSQRIGAIRTLYDDVDDDDDAADDDEDNLSEIRIPAGEDYFNDDDLDRFSTESFSHYEDIEMLSLDNIYLDPQRPSDNASSSTATGRTPSAVRRRRNEMAAGYGTARGSGGRGSIQYGYSYAYGRTATPALSRRRDEMIAELETTDRKLLAAGTILILDPQETDCFTESRLTSPELEDSIANNIISSDKFPVQNLLGSRLAYDARYLAFYVPAGALRRHGDPSGERWFYPVAMTPCNATHFLRAENQPGCFVVYRPLTPPSAGVNEQPEAVSLPLYYLSVCLGNGGDVVHYRIISNPRGDVSVAGHDHSFLNVSDLVSYFRHNRSGLAVRLGRPLADAGRAAVDLSATAARLTLNRRDLTLSSRVIRHRPTLADVEATIDDGGQFGKTFVGRYRGRPVAVSVMARQDFSESAPGNGNFRAPSSVHHLVDEFLEPALDVVAGLRHDNVVRLIGVSCTEFPFYVVYEHSSNAGTLADCLAGRLDAGRVGYWAADNVEMLFNVCLQASAAVAYLQSQQFVLHRDIAARSFVVVEGTEGGLNGGDRLIKLSNFERARRVNDDDYQAPLSEAVYVRWAAPEVLVESRYSTKSDVWSLGILFWEVFSCAAVPYQSIGSIEKVAMHVGNNGGRPDRPTGPCPDDLWAAIRACWRHRPLDRPTPTDLYERRLKGQRSKIYAGLAEPWSPTNSVSKTSVRTSNALSPLVIEALSSKRRAMPLPVEPELQVNAGEKSPLKTSTSLSSAGVVEASPLARDRLLTAQPSVDSRPALNRENRWSDHSGGNDSARNGSAKTSSTLPSHGQPSVAQSTSSAWDTASIMSTTTARSSSLRQSFMSRLLPRNRKKIKNPPPTLYSTTAVTEEWIRKKP